MMNQSIGALTVLLLCVLLGGCKADRSEDEEVESSTPAVITVKTAPIRRGTIELAVTATGKTDAVRKEKILAPVTGVLLSLPVLEGSTVRRGDVVAVIQPKETRAAITGAEALLRGAQTEAERLEARQALELALARQNNVEVRAPSDGIIASREVTEGELLSENGELMTELDLSTLLFVASIPLQNVPDVRPRQHASILFQSLPAHPFPATVQTISPDTDPQSQSVKVRLAFAAGDRSWRHLLKTEMSGIARIVTGIHAQVLLVPKAALIRNDETERYTVALCLPDSIARIVPVTVEAWTDSTAEVRGAGLDAGMQVVIEGHYALADSARVAPLR